MSTAKADTWINKRVSAENAKSLFGIYKHRN